ncbi:MAG: hypothetical protein M1822_008250 [Bathelium mastoideum]|nr:MAG: hypothetical protein M1822_008250 [Bathelium mastoideum]
MSVPARNTKGDNNNLKSEQKLKQTLRQLLELIANFKSHDDPDFEQTLKPLRNIEENDDPDFDSPMPREVLTALIENYERQAQWSSDAGRFRIAEEHQRHMIEHAEEWNAFYEPPRDIARMKKKWKRLIQRQETLGELTNDGRIFQDALPFRRNDRREIYPPSPTRNIPKQSDLDAWIIISRSESFLNLAKDLYQEYLNGGRSRALYQSYLYAKESFKYRFYLKHLPDSGFQQSVELLILVNSHLKRHIEAETYRNMFLQAHKLSSTPGSETTIAPHSPNSSQDQLPLSSRQLQAQSQQLSSPPTTSAFRQSSKPLIDLEATDPMTHYPILISAILSRSLDSVDLLPRRSINANLVFNGRTALMYATHAGSYVNVTKLQSWGADIDQCEPAATGRTALHYAIELRAAEMVVALLEHGAGIEKRYNPETSQQGNGYVEEWVTPLLLAAQLKSPEITGILIDYGAHVGATDLNGRTALHLAVACREGQKQGADCAKLLLRAGADPNFQCAESLHTPLHDSVFYQNEASVRCLLERVGLLDLEVENCVGRTATSLAASMGLYNLLEMLLREGAQIPKLKQQRTKQWPVNVDISIKKTEKERKRVRAKTMTIYLIKQANLLEYSIEAYSIAAKARYN